MLEKLPIKDAIHLTHCFIQLGMWAVQDVLIMVDDAIVELPDE